MRLTCKGSILLICLGFTFSREFFRDCGQDVIERLSLFQLHSNSPATMRSNDVFQKTIKLTHLFPRTSVHGMSARAAADFAVSRQLRPGKGKGLFRRRSGSGGQTSPAH